MNSIDAFQKRLRDETATVEKEIQSHNQQVEALSKRLEGLKRAAELFESEQAAMVELLQAGTANGGSIPRQRPRRPHKCKKRRPAQRQPLRATRSGAILRSAAARERQDPTLALRATTAASHASI